MLNSEMFELYKKSGVDAMEICVAGELYDSLDLEDVCRKADAAGIEKWSFHLRFAPFDVIDPASLDKNIRSFTEKYQSEWIRRAAENGFQYAVIHPSGEPIKNEDRLEAMKRAKQTLFALGECADNAGITLAVEDLPRTCLGHSSDEILELISAHPSLRVCFDSNHLLTENNIDFLEKVKDKLVTVHISDYDFINERHWLPGEGKNDWVAIMDKLDEIDYSGVFMYEPAYASETIARPIPLEPRHFAINKTELENRAPLTKRGEPLKNLGMWGVEK